MGLLHRHLSARVRSAFGASFLFSAILGFTAVWHFINKPSVPPSAGVLAYASAAGSEIRRGDGSGLLAAIPRGKPWLAESYGKLPLSFEANSGQTDSQVRFLSRGRGYSLFLTGDEAVLSLRTQKPEARNQNRKSKSENRNSKGSFGLLPRFDGDGLFPKSALASSPIGNQQSSIVSPPAPAVLRMKLVDANANAKVTGLDESPGKSNYFIGNNPKKWRTNVSSYAKVKYEGIYPGIDLIYYGNQRQLEYDFIVAPGADPQPIAMDIRGADKVELDAAGDLVLRSSVGDVRLHKPVVYQEEESGVRSLKSEASNKTHHSPLATRHFLDGRFVLTANHQVRFALGPYDKSRPLVIDPYVSYLAYMGGGLFDYAWGVAVDSNGNAYVTGSSDSLNFPTVNAFQPALSGTTWDDVFVAKVDPTGSSLVYSTYLGGLNTDEGFAIAVDSSGNAYVAGFANSLDFPTTPASYNAQDRGAFVAKLNPAGDGLVYSVLLGEGDAGGIAVDASGRAYVTGYTYQYGFPTTPGAYNTDKATWAGQQSFLTIINASGSALAYSTFLGGTGDENSDFGSCTDHGEGAGKLAVDSSGMAYLTGFTKSLDFPTTTGAFQRAFGGGASDGFVAKLNPAGNGAADLVYSTYLGGTSADYSCDIAVDSSGNAYVGGQTYSTDFPVVDGSYRTTFTGGLSDGFVTKLNSTGKALVYSTYLGGTLDGWFNPGLADEAVEGIAVDASGNAYVTGWTEAADFPVVQPVQPRSDNLAWDIFVTKLSADGSSLGFSTTLGTYFDFDWGYDIAVDSSGSMYVVGPTTSTNFLVTTGNFNLLLGNDGTYNGGAWDAFVTKISPALVPQIGVSQISATFSDQAVGGASGPTSIVIGNYTSAPIDMTEIHVLDADGNPSPDFRVDPKGCIKTLVVGETCTIEATFNPGSSSGSSSSIRNSVSKALRPGDGSGSLPADTAPSSKLLTGALTTTTTTPDATKVSTIPLIGTVLLPVVSAAPASLDFSDQPVFTQSSTQAILVTNGGLANLTISTVDLTGTDSSQFLLNGAGCSGHVLGPQATCSISVAFAPMSTGIKAAAVSMTSNASSGPNTIALTGNGIHAGPGGVSPVALDFKWQRVGAPSSVMQVTLFNSSGGPLTISSFGLSGGDSGDFAITRTCPLAPGSLGAGEGCLINVTFTPTAAKPRKTMLKIDWNASSGPRRVMLTGIGTAIGTSPPGLTFASQPAGTTSTPQTVTVHNYGSAPVSVWSAGMGGANKTQFDQTNSCPVPPATLAANGSCSISVRFKPMSAGAKAAALLISHDGGGSPASVGLTGTGTSAFQIRTAESPVVIVPQILSTTVQPSDEVDPPSQARRKAKAKGAKHQTGPP